MTRIDVALQLTLKVLDNFSYNVEEYGGNTLSEHAEITSEIAATIFNNIYKNLKDE